MRKIFLALFIISTLINVSCKKDLDQVPISTATTETFYKQPSDFIQGTNAVYNSLRGYPDRLMFLSECRSDNIYPINDVARDPDPINNFSNNIATNTYIEEAWNADFNGIFKANTVLDQIAKNGTNIGNPSLANRLKAEVSYLRAFFYFDLVKYFGRLPIVDHPMLASEAVTIRRSSVDSVYKVMIIPDLQFAIANLPSNYTGTFPNYSAGDVGRATKYAAEALLGLVYMTRSGPTYGIEGPGLGLNEWSLAAPLLTDVLSGPFSLNPKYDSVFFYSIQNPAVNKEAIFDVMYLTGQTPVLGATHPWQLVPQNYFNSLPAGNTPANGALGYPAVSNNLIASYTGGDTRKAKIFHTTPFIYTGTVNTAPFYRKYLDTTKIPTSRFDWGINFIAIRYTDVLLLKAECVLHGAPGSQTTDVDNPVNLIRARGGLGTVTNVTLAQLLDERRRELAGEGSRWFDLQRSGNLITIMNAWIAADDATLHKVSPVVANFVIYPVPQSQLDAAPGLYTQNLGY